MSELDPHPLEQTTSVYFGDCTIIEPRVIAIYDDIIPRLDRAIGDSRDGTSSK